MLKYFVYFYEYFLDYFCTKNITYNLPFNIQELMNDADFNKFKNNNEINKIIFALNNLPDNIHKLLFNNFSNVCQKYYFIAIKLNNNQISEMSHNLEDINIYLQNNEINFIYIRLNIIISSKINHVNCVIIDKKQKYILFFEPKCSFLFNISNFIIKLNDIIDFSDFNNIFPVDLGYNSFNCLQKYDAFCQTYVLFIYLLIITNENIPYKNFHNMFNSIITYENMGYFLFNIGKLLKLNKYEICDQSELWCYPTNKTKNFFNLINLFFNVNEKDKGKEIIAYETNNLNIEDNDDLLLIDVIH